MVELLSVSISSSKESLMDGLYDNKCQDMSLYDNKCRVLEAAFDYIVLTSHLHAGELHGVQLLGV